MHENFVAAVVGRDYNDGVGCDVPMDKSAAMRRSTSVRGGLVCLGAAALAASLLLIAQGCGREGNKAHDGGDEARGGFLYGEFVDAEGRLLPGISYTLTSKDGKSGGRIRDARDGRFEIRGLDTEVKWRLVTYDRRYVTCYTDDVVASESGTYMRVVLTPGLCLRVKVVDENRAPVSYADVQCESVAMGRTCRVAGRPTMATLQRNGSEWELFGLPEGPCQVYVKAMGLLPQTVEVDVPLEGEPDGGTIEIALSFGHRASIRVLAAEDDEPIAGAVVTMVGGARGSVKYRDESTAEGVAELSGFAEAASFECRVEKEGFIPGSVSCRTDEECVVRLVRGARIVLMLDSEGSPLPARASVTLFWPDEQNGRFALGRRHESVPLENGAATVTGLRPSIYNLSMDVAGFGRWTSRGIVVEGNETREIKVELRAETVVRGHVCAEETGLPLGGVEVMFSVHGNKFLKYTVTDENGAYEFKGVPRGEGYILFKHSDRCFVEQAGIVVDEEGTLDIPVVSLARGGKIVCRLRSTSPVIKNLFVDYTEEGGKQKTCCISGTSAVKEIQVPLESLSPGNYALTVRVNGKELKASATVCEGEVSEVTFDVEK